MDSAARVDQVKVAAYTRWPQSQRWPVRAARRERFSAEPPDQPTEELLVITDALQPDRWRIRHGSSHAAKGCGIAVASPATGLTAAFAWLSSGAPPSKRSHRRRLCAFGASFPRRPSLPTQGACLGLGLWVSKGCYNQDFKARRKAWAANPRQFWHGVYAPEFAIRSMSNIAVLNIAGKNVSQVLPEVAVPLTADRS